MQEKGGSMLGVFMRLDFCEHNDSRKDCVSCGGSSCYPHGKRRRDCAVCVPFVKRRRRY